MRLAALTAGLVAWVGAALASLCCLLPLAVIVLGLGSKAAIVLGLGGMAAIVLRLWETAAITDLPSPPWPAICTTTPLALAIDPQTSAAEAAASGRD